MGCLLMGTVDEKTDSNDRFELDTFRARDG